MSTNNFRNENESSDEYLIPPMTSAGQPGNIKSIIPLINNPNLANPISLFTLRSVPTGSNVYANNYLQGFPPFNAIDYVDSSFWFSNETTGELTIEFPASEYIYYVEFIATSGAAETYNYTIYGKKIGEPLKQISSTFPRYIQGGFNNQTKIEPIPVIAGYYDTIKIVGKSSSGTLFVAINEVYLR
ncbi:TPA: hypothetical protein ROX84_004140 [Bacillus thuringiensis]|nr:hypothetical protein [Bacillus thuringiensis]